MIKGKEVPYDLESKINWAVFPALQGGPHQHQIAAISVALKEAQSKEFKEYQIQTKENAKYLAELLNKKGYSIVSGGTDVHMFLLDLSSKGIDGARVEKALEQALITVNKNTVPGDTKPLVPSGLRIGTPAITTRGMKEKECEQIADFLDRGVQIAVELNKLNPENSKKLSNFASALQESNSSIDKLSQLRKEVIEFSNPYPLPGF